ncbi:MAG TPA: FAD:protein FMN transferase [Burkholderiaceae bacterium]|nr:FAD:protein FMN transferase [Burkholderiaceae bacterium]
MATRRRFLAIAASSAALAGLPPLRATAAGLPASSVWRGTALGASASMMLVHPDRDYARTTIARCVDEIERLEAIFSLYRSDSALVRLNRDGRLDEPPGELVELLSFALSLARRSGGAFDPTVQPLYRLYAEHFARPGADPGGPPPTAVAAVLASVDHQAVEVEAAAIELHRPRMAVTLNGVAQGFITDRIGAMLRRAGFENVLIDIGEALAIGHRADGREWRAAVADPARQGRTLFELAMGEDPGSLPALATSSGRGTRFGPGTRLHHLLDPRSGVSADHHAAVSVAAPRATLADGLSTALSIVPPARAASLASWPDARAWFVDAGGSVSAAGTGADARIA